MWRHVRRRSFVVFALTAPLVAQAQFVERTPTVIAATTASIGVVGDFDGDGDTDALTVGYLPSASGTNHRLLRNDGAETFTDVTATHLLALPPNFYDVQDAVAFDKDGDGDLDVAFGLHFQNWLWENDGTGHFTDVSGQLPPVVYGFQRLVAADLDGDGDHDLAGIPLTLGASVQVFVNDGTGAFAPLPSWPTFTWPVAALAVADLDADGDLDVLGVGAAGLALWRNQGAMTFVDVSASWSASVPAANFRSIVTGDLDGDGDVDAVLGGNTGVADLVLRNTGGSFVVGVTLPVQADAATRALLVDVDEDGDLDWLRGQAGVGLALNDGLGNLAFAPARVGPAVGSSATLLAADFDRDGDADLLIGDYLGATQSMSNRHRELRAGQPVIGQVWTVEIWSQPGYANGPHLAVLGTGLAAVAQPVALVPFGLLWLDLGATHVLSSAVVPTSSGVATFPFPVPNVPALIGFALHVQALLVAPPSAPQLTAYFPVVVQ